MLVAGRDIRDIRTNRVNRLNRLNRNRVDRGRDRDRDRMYIRYSRTDTTINNYHR